MANLDLPIVLLCIVICVSAEHHILLSRDPLAVAEVVTNKVISTQQFMTEMGGTVEKIPEYTRSLLFEKESSVKYLKDDVSECAHSMFQLGLDIKNREKYSLKMVDAWGKLPSGLERGNLMWMGRYYECLNSHSQNFSGKWCLLGLGLSVNPITQEPMSTAGIGTCLPDTCSQMQISNFFRTVAPQLTPVVSCPVQPTIYTAADITALTICALLGLAMLFGTCYEIYRMYFANHKQYHEILNDVQTVQLPCQREDPKYIDILLSFSVIRNARSILNTSQKEGNINALHGIRFISMTWVVMGHVFLITIQLYDNATDFAEDMITMGSYQALLNASFSVDSFFFLSGLLVVYLGMREMEKRNGKFQIFWAYLYRYLRLTPAYALCVLVFSSIYSKMGDGPIWASSFEASRKICAKYWWTNLLYINNIHPTTLFEECFPHSWYLANDMQFFILSPFILILIYKKPRIGKIALATGLLCNVIVTLALSWHYEEQPTAVGVGILFKTIFAQIGKIGSHTTFDANATTAAPFSPSQTETDKFFSDLYTKPWCRIGAYLVGMATGYYLHKIKLRVKMNRIFVLAMWAVAAITALSLLYGLWPHVKGYEISLMSPGASAFYSAVSRPLWALCLSWVVIACVSGYGGPINAFLSWKLFIPLSRLTYCAYLVHPNVIGWFIATHETRLHYSTNTMAICFLGLLLLSYGIAFIVSITIEMPMIGIMKILFPNKKSQTSDVRAFTNHAQEADA